MKENTKRIKVKVVNQEAELSVDEINALIKTLEDARRQLKSEIAHEFYTDLASKSVEEIDHFIRERTTISIDMDYFITGGWDGQVLTLIEYLSRDVMEALDLSGEYLQKANKVLVERGEEPLSDPKKM